MSFYGVHVSKCLLFGTDPEAVALATPRVSVREKRPSALLQVVEVAR